MVEDTGFNNNEHSSSPKLDVWVHRHDNCHIGTRRSHSRHVHNDDNGNRRRQKMGLQILSSTLSSSSSSSMIRIGFCLVPSGVDISYCVILSQTSSSGVTSSGGKHMSTNGIGRHGVEVMRGISGEGVC